jgi:hypothetical protein
MGVMTDIKQYTETEQCDIDVSVINTYYNDEITRIQIKPRYMKNIYGVMSVIVYIHNTGKIETRVWKTVLDEPIITEIVPESK